MRGLKEKGIRRREEGRRREFGGKGSGGKGRSEERGGELNLEERCFAEMKSKIDLYRLVGDRSEPLLLAVIISSGSNYIKFICWFNIGKIKTIKLHFTVLKTWYIYVHKIKYFSV